MREISSEKVTEVIEGLCIKANNELPADVQAVLEKALSEEESPVGQGVLQDLLDNAEIARRDQVPICQDTGFAVIFLEVGQEVLVTGGDLEDAVHEGVRRGYTKGYLRKSIVTQPFSQRVNTKDNTPAIIHTRIVPGDKIRITLAPKGGGSENMSALKMLKPADGVEGVKRFVLDTVAKAGPNPCPPVVVGVGVGGTIEIATLQAKKALLRTLNQPHCEPEVAELEAQLLAAINRLGIGPQGFGGTTTALAVHVETFPAHIASLPVAVNIQCHAARHAEAII